MHQKVSIESSTHNETTSYQVHGFHLGQGTTISPQDNVSVMSQFLPAALATFSLFFSHQPAAAAFAKSLQSCPTLCDPIDGSPPGSPVPGILQARTLEWVCHFLLQCMKVKSESEVTQSYLTLSDPMDCNLPGSSAHGIFPPRVLDWVAIAFSASRQPMYI